jgi:hypothetical protein
VSVQNPAGRGDTAVRRTRAVLFATVALTMLAISPAVQATDGFENVGSGYYSPSASTLGISADGRVVFGNGFVGYSRGWTSARDWAEVGGGVRLPAWNNGAVTASVTASIIPNQTTTYVSRLGVAQAFLRGGLR